MKYDPLCLLGCFSGWFSVASYLFHFIRDIVVEMVFLCHLKSCTTIMNFTFRKWTYIYTSLNNSHPNRHIRKQPCFSQLLRIRQVATRPSCRTTDEQIFHHQKRLSHVKKLWFYLKELKKKNVNLNFCRKKQKNGWKFWSKSQIFITQNCDLKLKKL